MWPRDTVHTSGEVRSNCEPQWACTHDSNMLVDDSSKCDFPAVHPMSCLFFFLCARNDNQSVVSRTARPNGGRARGCRPWLANRHPVHASSVPPMTRQKTKRKPLASLNCHHEKTTRGRHQLWVRGFLVDPGLGQHCPVDVNGAWSWFG